MKRLILALLLTVGTAAIAAPELDLRALQGRAQAGDADAQFALAEAYRSGRGVRADPEGAITWYRRAAGQGHVRASEELGFALFAHGDRREAMPYIEKAAARGEARAFYLLGTAHFNGDYAARDWPLAYAQTSRAAAAGLPAAQKNLELMGRYLLPADHAKADLILATLPPVRRPAPENQANVAAPAGPAPAAPIQTASAAPASKSIKSGKALTKLSRARSPAPPVPAPVEGAPADPAKAASAAVAGGNWKVQLGAFGSGGRARDRWKTLSAKVSSLGRYDRHVVAAASVQRLQAVGIASRADANALCHDVRAAGGDCLVIAP